MNPQWLSRADRLIRRGTFVLFIAASYFIIPYAFCPAAFEPVISLRYMLLGVLVAALAVSRLTISLMRREQPCATAQPIFVLLLAGFVLLHCLSIFAAVNKSEAVFESGKVFLFTAFCWYGVHLLLERPGSLVIVARAVTTSGIIVAVLGILEYWHRFRLIDAGMPPGATTLNRNLLSSFLFLGLGCVGWIVAADRRPWRIIGIVAAALTSYMLAATQSRAVWLAVSGSVLCIAAITLRLGIARSFAAMGRRISLFVMVGGMLMAACLAASLRPQSSDVVRPTLSERVKTMGDPAFASNRERLLLWGKTLSMIRAHPLLGVGAGNWKIALPAYGVGDLIDQDFASMNTTEVRPYNEFLRVCSETGVAGLALFAGLLLLCGLNFARGAFSRADHPGRMPSFFFLPVLCGFVIIMQFDFPLERIEHLIMLGTLFAFGMAIAPPRSGKTGVQHVRRFAHGGILLVAAACVGIGIFRLRGDIHTTRMRTAAESKQWSTVIAEADKAYSLLYTLEPSSAPLAWYRGTANFRLGNIRQALCDYRQARVCNPHNLHVLNDLGTCLSLTGDPAQAKACYLAALSISPAFEPTLLNLAAIYFNAHDYRNAQATLEQCRGPHIDPRYDHFRQTILSKCNKGGMS
jgi:O-antigen ligase